MAFHSVFLVYLAGLAFFSKAAPPGSADSKHPVFIKILDLVQGSPASNVPVKLYKEAADGFWELLNSNTTALKGKHGPIFNVYHVITDSRLCFKKEESAKRRKFGDKAFSPPPP